MRFFVLLIAMGMILFFYAMVRIGAIADQNRDLEQELGE